MKLSSRDASAWLRKPDPKTPAALIAGEDAMRVATRRKEVIASLIGPEGEVELRLTRIPGAELRKDPALVLDALKAQGFFPGPRVVLVEDATDGLAPVLGSALQDRAEGDAVLIVTAGGLKATSPLRKLFEGHRAAVSIVLYDDPPGPEEIAGLLAKAGLERVGAEARTVLSGLARDLDPGDFRQTIEKLGLYKIGDPADVTIEDIEAVAPRSSEAEPDSLLAIVAEGRSGEIAAVLRRLYAQGVGPVAICVAALRHFRRLHQAASDPGGPGQGAARLRPPVGGPRRDAVIRQAGLWGGARLESAIGLLVETDLQLRSSSQAPPHALVERMLIRLAMMVRR
ncbi:MAG: DNA polymerase III subunit delta [Rubellimicrobium sp.]|nr:DNA polymerase III subunit delta [Rubellimicrobium sp.]